MLKVLFASGNKQPGPEIFASHEDFLTFLRDKEYRGAICIPNIVVHPDGEPRHAQAAAGDAEKPEPVATYGDCLELGEDRLHGPPCALRLALPEEDNSLISQRGGVPEKYRER